MTTYLWTTYGRRARRTYGGEYYGVRVYRMHKGEPKLVADSGNQICTAAHSGERSEAWHQLFCKLPKRTQKRLLALPKHLAGSDISNYVPPLHHPDCKQAVGIRFHEIS